MFSKYMQPRDTRREQRTVAGRFKGGVLAPVMAVPIRESEGGMLNQSIVYELDPIAGKMITPITAEVISVFVPLQAIHALKNPLADYPGSADVLRQEFLDGDPIFGLEDETEVSKRLGVVPRSIAGVKKVNEIARLAHNCAVNFLRTRKYVNATKLDANNTAITPALISQTVLDRLNAVLDPEDRVNGAVSFSGELPVKGLGLNNSRYRDSTYIQTGQESGETVDTSFTGWEIIGRSDTLQVGRAGLIAEQDPNNPQHPHIRAVLDGAGGISLDDFYRAQRMDSLTRMMRQIVDNNPEYGEEMVLNFAHGLNIDPGKQPFILYEKQGVFGMSSERAMDGANLGTMQTNSVAVHEFTVPVIPTEFGGVVITFAAVKPDEALASQPHPILSEPWGATNYVADELALDPVPVTVRDLYADCDVGDEDTIACYIGNNHLKKRYLNYGFNRHLDPTTVEAKTAIWQLEVPMSVTPESVLYPESLDHYPFVDQLAEVCTYTVNSYLSARTPIIFGPTPVEELAAIETGDVFDDVAE